MRVVRSGRASGSPPVRSRCMAPASAACLNTCCQVSVESSSERAVSSCGLEQYTQCSGQRWVSSAIRARGEWAGISLQVIDCKFLSEESEVAAFPNWKGCGERPKTQSAQRLEAQTSQRSRVEGWGTPSPFFVSAESKGV